MSNLQDRYQRPKSSWEVVHDDRERALRYEMGEAQEMYRKMHRKGSSCSREDWISIGTVLCAIVGGWVGYHSESGGIAGMLIGAMAGGGIFYVFGIFVPIAGLIWLVYWLLNR